MPGKSLERLGRETPEGQPEPPLATPRRSRSLDCHRPRKHLCYYVFSAEYNPSKCKGTVCIHESSCCKHTPPNCSKGSRGPVLRGTFYSGRSRHSGYRERQPNLYSVEDLLQVTLLGDDLRTCINNWESVMAGLSHMPDETTRETSFGESSGSRKCLSTSTTFQIYDRARKGSEQHTYKNQLHKGTSHTRTKR